jgi:hypothetical protein
MIQIITGKIHFIPVIALCISTTALIITIYNLSKTLEIRRITKQELAYVIAEENK